jgi:predicted amidophosphoribosyltransferase
LDLVLPLECGGCGAPSTRWCDACARELSLRPDDPRLIIPRVDPHVPVFSLGRYAGARRAAIVAVKEKGRADLIGPLASVLGAGLDRLIAWRIVQVPITLVPAPTRSSAARRRGGDPVARMATTIGRSREGVRVVSALRMRAMTRDSVGLSTAARQANVAGRVVVARGVEVDGAVLDGRSDEPRSVLDGRSDEPRSVLLVDDIVTTGSTATESVRVLQSAGARVAGVIAIAHA